MIDTKKANEFADRLEKYNAYATSYIRDLADRVDWLRKELDHREHMDLCREQVVELLESRGEPTKLELLLEAAKVVQHGDSDSSAPYKELRDAIAAYEEVDHEDK